MSELGGARALTAFCESSLSRGSSIPAFFASTIQSQAARLSFEPSDGLRVVATGRVTIYPDRGQYQLRALELAPAGLGALMQALQALKDRLTREGLFEEARKRPLPRVPRTVGVVTSASGAAIRDVVRVLRSRWPAIEIVLAPVSVQGPGAAADIPIRRPG